MDSVGVIRHPILDRYRRLFAYEFRFRGPGSDQAQRKGVAKAEFQKLQGDRPVFVNVTEEFLRQGFTELLPRDRVILEFRPGEVDDRTLLRELREARREGFQVALTLNGAEGAYLPAQERLDYLRIDADSFDESVLDTLVAAARDTSAQLIAGNVATQDAFQRLLRKGFRYFHGQFFTRPVQLSRDPLPVHKANLLRLYRLIQGDAEIDEVEALFKQSPELSFRLLKLINSAAFAVRKRVQSIRHALVLLGRRNVRKWVAMLMYTGGADEFRNPLLAEAVIRGRVMELAGGRISNKRGFSDEAHITGTLSVVEALLNRPMDQIVQDLQLEDHIAGALLEREGDLGRLLEAVENLRREGSLTEWVNGSMPLALSHDDLVFYEQQATLEQATLELEGMEADA
jgi:EAL and modified HD-GYP domain-containing signal transduction protein